MHAYARIALIAVAAAALHSPAHAGVSLRQAVCSVRLSPGQLEGLGRSGGLIVSTKQSYADCADYTRPLQVFYLCSTAPTNLNCTSDTRAHYTEGTLMGLLGILTQARHHQDTVDVFFDGNNPNARGLQLRVGID